MQISTLIERIENLSFEYPSCSKSVTIPRETLLKPHCLNTENWRIRQALAPKRLKTQIQTFLQFMLNNVVSRGIFGFVFTFSLIFLVLFCQNKLSAQTSLTISSVMAGFVTIWFVTCKTFRCVVILSIPNFGTQQGRFVLFAITSSILVGGPLTTFSTNLGEFGKSAKCMALRTLKQGEEIMENYAQSYEDVYEFLDYHVEKLRITKEYVDKELKSLRNAISELRSHLGRFDKLLDDLADKCTVEVESGRLKCVRNVRNAFFRCKKHPVLRTLYIDDVCEIVWIGTDICEPVLNYNIVCAPLRLSQTLTEEVQKGIKYLQEALTLQYNVIKEFKHTLNHTINATQIEMNIRTSLENVVGNVILVWTVLKYLFLSALFWIPLKSYLFLRKVKQGFEVSSTAFLERFQEYNENQRQVELWSQGFLLLIHVFFSLAIFGMDYACYWVQNVVTLEEPGNLTIKNSYRFSLNVTVGQALLLNPVVDFQNDYLNRLSQDMTRNYTFTTATADCFPKPVAPSGFSPILIMLCIYLLVLVLIVGGNRMLKYRLKIVHFVIPTLKRDDERPALLPYSIPGTIPQASYAEGTCS